VPVAEPPSPSANALPTEPTPRAITAAAASIMVFIGLLLCSDPLLGSWVLLDRWSDCPVCDAQEIDLVSMKDNPD
jgi:hypothetical protein